MMSTTPAATEGAANNEVELNDLDRLDNINPNETMVSDVYRPIPQKIIDILTVFD